MDGMYSKYWIEILFNKKHRPIVAAYRTMNVIYYIYIFVCQQRKKMNSAIVRCVWIMIDVLNVSEILLNIEHMTFLEIVTQFFKSISV